MRLVCGFLFQSIDSIVTLGEMKPLSVLKCVGSLEKRFLEESTYLTKTVRTHKIPDTF